MRAASVAVSCHVAIQGVGVAINSETALGKSRNNGPTGKSAFVFHGISFDRVIGQ